MVRVLRPYLALLLVLGLWGLARAANPNVQADIKKLTEALHKQDNKAAPELVAKLLKNPQADSYEVMVPFRLRTKKGKGTEVPGFGIGATPPPGRRDGIEELIRDLARKEPTQAELAALGEDLVVAAQACAAIAAVLPAKNPKPKLAGKWNKFVLAYQDSSGKFVEAVQGGQPAAIHKAAFRLDNSCIICHNDFR